MGTNRNRQHIFRFKQFAVHNEHSAMKVGTDGVLLGALCPVGECQDILDVGAGTGLIALMLAQRVPYALIDAVEIEHAAYNEALLNVSESPWPKRINVIEGDFIRLAREGGLRHYDLIVSNPPFYKADVLSPDAARALARHSGALGPGTLMCSSRGLLNPGGRLVFISPYNCKDDILVEAVLHGFNVAGMTNVFTVSSASVPTRIIWVMTREAVPIVTENLYLDPERYREATLPFYL